MQPVVKLVEQLVEQPAAS